MRLQGVLSLERRARDLLGDDTLTLSPTTAVDLNVHLAKNDFAPGPSLELADLEEADFGGYAVLNPSAAPLKLIDPATQDGIVQLTEPAGGWNWVASGSPPANVPQTIYGVYITDNDDLTLYAAARLDTPIVIAQAGDFINPGKLQVRFPIGFLS